MMFKIKGLIAAANSPMHADGTINVAQIKVITDHLVKNEINGIYPLGSTGEGSSLTVEERMTVGGAYIEAANGRIPVIIHIGHNSLAESCRLAKHAQECDADAIAAFPPSFFKCEDVECLVDCLEVISKSAESLPLFYYHLPALTGADFKMSEFLRLCQNRIHNLAGIKYSAIDIIDLQECVDFSDGQYSILFGCDEMLITGLAAGASGAVGSTYNFAAPLYRRIVECFYNNEFNIAQKYQDRTVKMVRILKKYRGQPAFKAMMKIIGIDCGPNRLPLKTLSKNETKALKEEMEAIGFFNWLSDEDKLQNKKPCNNRSNY
jgi:N-acetylneuraminate lyase